MTLSATAKAAFFAQQTDQALIALVDVIPAAPDSPQYFCNHVTDIVSGGTTYTALPFGVVLPDDSDENVPAAQVVFDNVDQRIIYALRNMTSPPTIVLKQVLASTPNVIEDGPYTMELSKGAGNTTTIVCTLSYEDIFTEPFPGDFYTPENFPGLFRT